MPTPANPEVTAPVVLQSDMTWMDSDGDPVIVTPDKARSPLQRNGEGQWTDGDGHAVTVAAASSDDGGTTPAPTPLPLPTSITDLARALQGREDALDAARSATDIARAELAAAQAEADSKAAAERQARRDVDDAIDAIVAAAEAYDPEHTPPLAPSTPAR
jgi:hypothetical protein